MLHQKMTAGIKALMQEQDTEELTAGQYIIRWATVLSNRFDTTTFKNDSRRYRQRGYSD